MERTRISIAIAALLGLSACSGGSNGGNAVGSATTLSVSLMDAPVDDVNEVNVEIQAMWLKPAGDGPAFELPLASAPLSVDLLAHSSDNAAILVDDAAIEPGAYEWLAMDVNAALDAVFDSYVVDETELWHEIFVPSSRIRLVEGFEVGANEAVELLFDWDMRKGLVNPPGLNGYLLKPAFRIIDATEYGSLSGSIAVETVTAEDGDCNADSETADYDEGNVVYIYAGYDIAPDDIDESDDTDVEPLSTVDALLNAASTHYEYRTLLPFGEYTVAFTCQGANDSAGSNEAGNEDPETDTLTFFETTANVTLDEADPAASVDF